MIQINGNCSGSPTAPVEFVIDNGHRYPVTIDGSRFSIAVPVAEPSPYGAAIVCDGKQLARLLVPPPGAWEADQPPVDMQPSSLSFAPPAPPVAKLGRSGRDFTLNGARWPWKGSSDFRAYQWFLDGRNLSDLYAQRRAAGANLLRVFGMYDGGIGVFTPAQYGNAYFDGLIPFLREAASEGFQVELTAFADAQNIPELRDTNHQQEHWNRLAQSIQGEDNLVLELVNEYPQNGVDPNRFGPIGGFLCARGSSLSDSPPALPGWDYHTWHGRRDWPKVLFSAEDMWYVGEGWGPAGPYQYPVIPIVHDEPIGFADDNVPGRRSNDPYVARVLGQTGAAYGAGATFHSDAGIQSILWSERVEQCARTFYAAIT